MSIKEKAKPHFSKAELQALLEELFHQRLSPEFYHLQQSMLEVRARMGSLIAMLEARSDQRKKARPGQESP